MPKSDRTSRYNVSTTKTGNPVLIRSMPDISVVIPTFRREAQLIEAIDSVLAQNVATEIIVLDDSPEGSAREAVTRYPSTQVRYVLHQPPTGGKPAAVRNAGWQQAQGKYVHFLDDDDRVAADYYRAALNTFDQHPDIGLVFGLIKPFTSTAHHDIRHEEDFFAAAARRARMANQWHSRHWFAANQLFLPTMLVNSACIVRRECIAALNGYDLSLGLNEDVDFHSRMARQFGFRVLDQVVLHYRINPDSLMHGRTDDNKLHDAYRKIHARYQQQHGRAEFLALKLLARTVLKWI